MVRPGNIHMIYTRTQEINCLQNETFTQYNQMFIHLEP